MSARWLLAIALALGVGACVDVDVDAARTGGRAGGPCLVVSPERLDLRARVGETVVGTVTVENCGSSELRASASVEDGGGAGVLVEGEPEAPISLPAGWEAALRVRAAPRAAGVATARVVVTVDGLDPVVIPVTVTTTPP